MLARWIPILDWLPRYKREDLPGDVVAGLTAAAILVPQSMAYATVANLPPVVGLYASIVPVLVFSVFARSRQLSVGPLTSISILSAVGVAGLAARGTSHFIELSATLAVIVGVVHLAIGLTRLGFVVRFLSEPVVQGFLAGVAIVLIVTQLGAMTGIVVPTSDLAYETFWEWAKRLDGLDLAPTMLSLGSLGLLLYARRWRRLPTPLLLLIVSTVAVAVFDLQNDGIAIVGHVPGGLAGPQLPDFEWHAVVALVPVAIAITIISVLESLSLARDDAERHGYEIETNHEIEALGAANVAAGFFQGMVVTAAISRSTIVDDAGARTQLNGIIAALTLIPLLLFGTSLFEDIPLAVLGVIVTVAVLPFLRVGEARRLWRVRRSDCVVGLASFVGTLVLGIEMGVVVAALLSVAMIVARVTRPRLPELVEMPDTDACVETRLHPDIEPSSGIVVIRIDAPLYFVNAEAVQRRLFLLPVERPDLRGVVIDAGGVDDLDATADHALRKVAQRYADAGIKLLFADVHEEVRAVMDASGLTAMVGESAFFATDADALASLA
jgi:SulP family sulfate permease